MTKFMGNGYPKNSEFPGSKSGYHGLGVGVLAQEPIPPVAPHPTAPPAAVEDKLETINQVTPIF